MSKVVKYIKSIVLILVIFALLLSCISCGHKGNEVFVTWMDTDGTLIESQTVKQYYDPTERPLPRDSDSWHYTGWTISQSGNVIVCTAKRVEKNILFGKIITEIFLMKFLLQKTRKFHHSSCHKVMTNGYMSVGIKITTANKSFFKR